MSDNPLSERIGTCLHDPRTAPADLVVIIAHRGADGDRKALRGTEIAAVHRSALELHDGTQVPLHRVIEVAVRGDVVWPAAR